MRTDDWRFGDVIRLPSGVTVMCVGVSIAARVCEDGYVAHPGRWIGLTLDADPQEQASWPMGRTCAIDEMDEMWEKVG